MKEQNDYTRFSNRVTAINGLLIDFFFILIVILAISIKVSLTWLIILSALLVVVYSLAAFVSIRYMNHKLDRLKEQVYGKQRPYQRTGLFKEIWDEYEYDHLEGWTGNFHSFHSTKIRSMEDFNNSIDIHLSIGKHEILIEIDETGIHLICDEETDHPSERELTYSDYDDIDSLYADYFNFIVDCVQ